jgi:hypothetical protein
VISIGTRDGVGFISNFELIGLKCQKHAIKFAEQLGTAIVGKTIPVFFSPKVDERKLYFFQREKQLSGLL